MKNTKFAVIAAVDSDMGIGFNQRLLFRNPIDMAHFKETTTDHIVIMGRNTFQSMLSKPLPNRVNIVVSSKLVKNIPDGVIVVHTIEEAFRIANMISVRKGKKVFVIGGAQIYDECLPFANEVILTVFDSTAPFKDKFFDNNNVLLNFEIYKYAKLKDGSGKIEYYRPIL